MYGSFRQTRTTGIIYLFTYLFIYLFNSNLFVICLLFSPLKKNVGTDRKIFFLPIN